MATLQLTKATLGQHREDFTFASSADTATLATALGTNSVMLVWDPAKVPDRQALDRLMEEIEELVGRKTGDAWPPA